MWFTVFRICKITIIYPSPDFTIFKEYFIIFNFGYLCNTEFNRNSQQKQTTMIFYFSATGNSLWVARQLGQHFGLKIVSVADSMKKGEVKFDVSSSRYILFVFPIHSWGPSVTMMKFMNRMELTGADGKPVYAVCTCGDDCGRTDTMIKKILSVKGINLTAAFSVAMPNSYIVLPFFDVDSKEVEQRKLNEAPARIEEIEQAIESGEPRKDLYKSGSAAWFKTNVINSGFRKYIQGETAFRVTDKCISCGLCVEVCPENNIKMGENGRPVWDKHCVQCLACIHRCPEQAIEYGKISVGKGRYKNPLVY